MFRWNRCGRGLAIGILTALPAGLLPDATSIARAAVDQPFLIAGGSGETATDEMVDVTWAGNKYMSVHVTWTTDSHGEPNGDIYGTFLDPITGTTTGFPVYLSPIWESSTAHPAVAYDPLNDRYLIVFEDRYNIFYSDIYMILLDGQGIEIAQDFVNVGGSEDILPDVAYGGDGTFIVTWSRQPDPASPDQAMVMANVVTYEDTALLTQEMPFYVSDDDPEDACGAARPTITAGANGQVLILWQRPVNTTNPDPATWSYNIEARVVGIDAQPIGPVVTLAATTRSETAPSAVYDANDDLFLVAWQDNASTSNGDIRASFVTVNEFGAISATAAMSVAQLSRDDTAPVVSWNQNLHKFIVAWEGKISTTNRDLFARQITPAGMMYSPFVLVRNTRMQQRMAIARGVDSVAVVYEDQVIGASDSDIFGVYFSDVAPAPHVVAVSPALAVEQTRLAPLAAVSLTFDRDVLVTAGDITVVGRKVGARNDFVFSYDQTAGRVTLTWAVPLANDAYVLTAKDTITSLRGEFLDGDMNLTSPLLPSGNGTTGGNFVGLIYRLVGDVNLDGFVNVGDLQLLIATWNGMKGFLGFNAGADFDANDVINAADLQIMVANWAASIHLGT